MGGIAVITIYKDRKDIPQGKDYVELNDVFFNKNTAVLLVEVQSGNAGCGLPVNRMQDPAEYRVLPG